MPCVKCCHGKFLTHPVIYYLLFMYLWRVKYVRTSQTDIFENSLTTSPTQCVMSPTTAFQHSVSVSCSLNKSEKKLLHLLQKLIDQAPSLQQVSWKPVWSFLCNLVDLQTHGTENINLLDGGDKCKKNIQQIRKETFQNHAKLTSSPFLIQSCPPLWEREEQTTLWWTKWNISAHAILQTDVHLQISGSNTFAPFHALSKPTTI